MTGLGDRCNKGGGDRPGAGTGHPGEPVAGFGQDGHRADDADPLDAPAFEGEVGHQFLGAGGRPPVDAAQTLCRGVEGLLQRLWPRVPPERIMVYEGSVPIGRVPRHDVPPLQSRRAVAGTSCRFWHAVTALDGPDEGRYIRRAC